MNTLKCDKLTKSFGGFMAVCEVDLETEQFTIHSIIGPNGAGKTTLFNLISGQLFPSSGRIKLNGLDITDFEPYERLHLGISRSFQVTNIFRNLPVFENIRIAAQARLKKESRNFLKSHKELKSSTKKAEGILTQVGLAEQSFKMAYELSHGDQRILEIGLCLASDPIFLLLDEPTAGMSSDETQKMMKMVKGLSKSSGVLVIEHDIEVVMSISNKVTVLHEGSKIAEGKPEEIKNNDQVKKVYLGSGNEAFPERWRKR